MQPVDKTRTHNETILNQFGFSRLHNTTVFLDKNQNRILSPSVSKGAFNKYWFDIRLVNVERMKLGKSRWFLLRIVPDMFAFLEFEIIERLLTPETMEIRPHSNEVWAFFCNIRDDKEEIEIYINEKLKIKTSLLDRNGVQKALNIVFK